MEYTADIGLEVHVQLKTASKMFCRCSTKFGAEPNTNVCSVCLGYPGTMPTMNEEAVRLTVMAGLMLGCEISTYSKFDRKSYFYPDMPKNYQISQYDKPLCLGGVVQFEVAGRPVACRITRIHLEEDTGKNMHFAGASGVDFNRAGVPLMEIVTDPDMHSADDAFAFLQALRRILLYAGVSDCNLEEGNMRCDINASVRPPGAAALGVKAEIKNMNTFKGVHAALSYELHRQTGLLDTGEAVVQETRRWDADAGVTLTMRTKEDAHDYRYFPEPDLMPVALSRELVEGWRKCLPELPRDRRDRFVSRYGLPEYDAGVLAADKAVGDYFESAAARCSEYKALSNWIMTEMLRWVSESGQDIGRSLVTPAALAELVGMVKSGTVGTTAAKEVLGVMMKEGGAPSKIVGALGLAQVSDSGAIAELVARVVAENTKSVEDYRKGKQAAMQFLVGQVMRLSRGKANPQIALAALKEKLG